MSLHVLERWRERVDDSEHVDSLEIKRMLIAGEILFQNEVRLVIKHGNLCFPCKKIENGKWKIKTVLLFNEMINSKEDIVGRCME